MTCSPSCVPDSSWASSITVCKYTALGSIAAQPVRQTQSKIERGQSAAAPVLVSSVSQLHGCPLHADSRLFAFADLYSCLGYKQHQFFFQRFISPEPAFFLWFAFHVQIS